MTIKQKLHLLFISFRSTREYSLKFQFTVYVGQTVYLLSIPSFEETISFYFMCPWESCQSHSSICARIDPNAHIHTYIHTEK